MLGSNEDGGVEWEEGHRGNISNEICKIFIWIPSEFADGVNFNEAHEQHNIYIYNIV